MIVMKYPYQYANVKYKQQATPQPQGGNQTNKSISKNQTSKKKQNTRNKITHKEKQNKQ